MSDLGNKEIFAKNLKYYMNLYNKTRNEICDDLNLSYTTFTSWLNGTNYPRIDKIEMLANYFRINKADLIEDKYKDSAGYYTDPEVAEYAEELRTNPKYRLLFDASKDLSKEDIDFVVNMIEQLKAREGKE
ncbi:helix-turn-helix domain-containing protein [Colibacter massiliensis]|uniref:helix-turn-helix domain-containing protein n=1 Tax=Colibacter massiliensis TaxID=1852379 RepID=UPI003F8F4E64